MFTRLKKLFTRTSKQYTFCYCPKCHNELCGSRGDIDESSYVKHYNDNTVHYRCLRCATETRWFFDCPAPILLETLGKDGEFREVPSEKWQCPWLDCDWGTGLAGRDSCPGNPRDHECIHFTTEYSDYKGDEQTGGDAS